MLRLGSLSLANLRKAYAAGARPSELVAAIYDRICSAAIGPAWIHLRPREEALRACAEIEAQAAARESLPLYGVPFGVKDNIDVAGMPTTAACPAFSYTRHAASSCCSRRARFASARPISINSPPAFPEHDRRMERVGRSAIRCMYRAARVPVLRSLWGQALSPSRSGPTPVAPDASPPASTASSASSRRSGVSRPVGSCRIVRLSTAFPSSRSRLMTGCKCSR